MRSSGVGRRLDLLLKSGSCEPEDRPLAAYLLKAALFVCPKGSVDLEREEGEEGEENMEVFDDSSSSPSGTLRNYPLTCKVLYSYKV